MKVWQLREFLEDADISGSADISINLGSNADNIAIGESNKGDKVSLEGWQGDKPAFYDNAVFKK